MSGGAASVGGWGRALPASPALARRAFALLSAFVAAAPLWAGEPGVAGADFLTLGAGPRALAMAGAQTAAAGDAYAAYWNPAGLGVVRRPEAAFMHNQLYEGISQQHLAYAQPLRVDGTAAASLTRLAVAPMPSYDANGASLGSVGAGSLSAGLAYGQLVTPAGSSLPDLMVGGGVKWLRESLAFAKAQTFAFDAGLLVTDWGGWLGSWSDRLRLGLALRHWGSGLKFHAERSPLPTTAALGVAVDGRLWGSQATMAADLEFPRDDRPIGAIGAEFRIQRALSFRAGLRTGQDEGPGVRLGLGLRAGAVDLDYAFAPFGGLGNAHRFGVKFHFGGRPESAELTGADLLGRARHHLTHCRLHEAVQDIRRALERDPGDPDALDLLRRSSELLRGGDCKPTGSCRD